MRLALYVYLKNSCDGVGGQEESNGTPLDPPLFWLDNIFKQWKVSVSATGRSHDLFHISFLVVTKGFLGALDDPFMQ